MNLSQLINEYADTGFIGLFITLTLVQIAPLKLNPWSYLFKVIGSFLNVDVFERLDEQKATTARYRILRFDDECRHKVLHSEEHFNQIIEDINAYEDYCNTHPTYVNNKAVIAIQNIKDVYSKCKKESMFLK